MELEALMDALLEDLRKYDDGDPKVPFQVIRSDLAELAEHIETGHDEVGRLAVFIMGSIPGEPSQNEGAVDTAIRVMKKYRAALDAIMHELGVPGPGYPAPVANAYQIAKDAWVGES